jgi:HEPN domain-containing protein
MATEVEAWVAYAEEDLSYGLLGMSSYPRPAVWSFQQAALKAILLQQGWEPPRSHDLLYLLGIIEANPEDELRDAVAESNVHGPSRRYPGDFAPVSPEDARAAKEAIMVLRAWARSVLTLPKAS